MRTIPTSSEANNAPVGPLFGRGLAFLTGGQVILNLGEHFMIIAISAYTYWMTRSAWDFALGQLVMFLPWVLFSNLAGPLVDRFDRRRVMIAADIARALICLAYPLTDSIGQILVLNFLRSTIGVFGVTARTALVPGLSQRDSLLRVNGIRTSVFGAVDMIGPAIAGAFTAALGTTAAFRLTGLAAFGAVLCFLGIPAAAGRFAAVGRSEAAAGRSGGADRPSTIAALGRGPGPRLWRDLREAAAFLRADRVLLSTVLMYCIYTAGQNGTNALFYPYLDSVLKAGPAAFGLSNSFYFGANFLSGILLARWGPGLQSRPIVIFLVPITLVWLSYSLTRYIPLVLVLCFVEGLVFSLLSTLLVTRVQERAPAGMTGRVWGLTSTITSSCEATGILAAGAVAGRWGPRTAYRTMAAAGMILVLLTSLLKKPARQNEAPAG